MLAPIRSALAIGGLLLWSSAAQARAAQEGPLRNDAYVAIDERAAAELARGDALLAEARAGSGQGPDSARLAAAFEAWRAACEGAGAGAAVPLDLARFQDAPLAIWPDPGGEAGRRTEAVPYGVLRRLALLGPQARRAWAERLGPLAFERLAAAGRDPARLAALERELPGTLGAARAALARADLELEAGRGYLAAGWLERAAAHATDAQDPDSQPLRAALESRLRLAAAQLEPAPAPAPDGLERVGALQSPSSQRLPQPRGGPPRPNSGGPELGLCALSDGGVAVVGPDFVWLRGEGRPSRAFEPSALLRSQGLDPLPSPGSRLGPRVPSLPRAVGPDLVLTLGRADPGGGRGNALLGVRPPAGVGLPTLSWALGPFGHFRPDAPLRQLGELLGEGVWEFQQGPLPLAGALYVQARRFAPTAAGAGSAEGHQAEAWLLALEAATGELLWARFLGQGGEVRPEQADRHGANQPLRSPAEPVARVGSRLFAGTGLGLGALVEPADGRLVWTFQNRRRRSGEAGWRVGGAAPYDRGPAGAGGELYWAPGDSDHLYLLRATPDLAGAALLAAPPDPIGQGEELLAGTGRRALVLSALGPRRTVEERDLATGERRRSVLLRPGERFLGGALVTPARALVASDRGLYLLDRSRELRLVAQAPLERVEEARGGGILAQDARIWLLVGDALFAFGVE